LQLVGSALFYFIQPVSAAIVKWNTGSASFFTVLWIQIWNQISLDWCLDQDLNPIRIADQDPEGLKRAKLKHKEGLQERYFVKKSI
jgi:hypothetical protein